MGIRVDYNNLDDGQRIAYIINQEQNRTGIRYSLSKTCFGRFLLALFCCTNPVERRWNDHRIYLLAHRPDDVGSVRYAAWLNAVHRVNLMLPHRKIVYYGAAPATFHVGYHHTPPHTVYHAPRRTVVETRTHYTETYRPYRRHVAAGPTDGVHNYMPTRVVDHRPPSVTVFHDVPRRHEVPVARVVDRRPPSVTAYHAPHGHTMPAGVVVDRRPHSAAGHVPRGHAMPAGGMVDHRPHSAAGHAPLGHAMPAGSLPNTMRRR